MEWLRQVLSFVIVAAFVLTSALSHAHPMGEGASADTGHHMQHAAADDHAHHHDMDGDAPQSEDAPHCCSMGPCGFLAPASPHLSHSAVTQIALEMTASRSFSVETPPDAPPPRSVG